MNTVPSHAQRLEGSRFVASQFYRMAAGGSREQPSVFFYMGGLCFDRIDQRVADRTAQPWAVPGSRLQPNRRAASLQSGSPPGAGRLLRAACLQTFLAPGSLPQSFRNPSGRTEPREYEPPPAIKSERAVKNNVRANSVPPLETSKPCGK